MRAKTILITGASRGIGRQAALDFGRLGWNVVVHYHSHEAEAREVQRQIGANALALRADMRSREEIEGMAQRALEAFGRVDVLVNNAAIAAQGLLGDMHEVEWLELFNVNVHGAYRCIHALLPHMIRRKEGKILNVSSIWGISGASCEVCYSATKAALIGLTKALAKELGPSHIQVNCVAPGVIDTEMNHHLDKEAILALVGDTPLGRVGSTVDVSAALRFLASEQADFITGQVLTVDGGFLV